MPDLPHLRGRRTLAADNMPGLIWFLDPADPATARRCRPEEIPALLGQEVRLADAFVEITGEPVVFDIDKKLRWLKQVGHEQKDQAC